MTYTIRRFRTLVSDVPREGFSSHHGTEGFLAPVVRRRRAVQKQSGQQPYYATHCCVCRLGKVKRHRIWPSNVLLCCSVACYQRRFVAALSGKLTCGQSECLEEAVGKARRDVRPSADEKKWELLSKDVQRSFAWRHDGPVETQNGVAFDPQRRQDHSKKAGVYRSRDSRIALGLNWTELSHVGGLDYARKDNKHRAGAGLQVSLEADLIYGISGIWAEG